MKTLSDLHNQYITDSLLSHLAIDYKLNDIALGKRIINEKYGIYDGCEELADYIINTVFNNDNLDNEFIFHKDELKDIENIFFNELILDIDTSEDYGGECDDNIVINKDLLVDEVRINIYLVNPTKSEVKSILMHELTHVYNNYVMQLKGNKNFLNTAQSTMYRNIVTPDDDETIGDIKRVLYFLIGYERNAFIAQLKAELSKHDNKIKTPLDALKVLKQCPIYNVYINVKDIIDDLIERQRDTEEAEFIADIYKEITGTENSNESTLKILKRLKAQSTKAIKKLDSIIPKLCIENLNNIKWHREIYPI